SSSSNGSNEAKKIALAVGISTTTAILLAGLTTFIVRKRRNSGRNPLPRVGRGGTNERSQELPFSGQMITHNRKYSSDVNDVDDLELPIYDFHSMVIATDNFCEANKLGQGGFGRVYKVLFCFVKQTFM
ncbi:hypothetical protein KSS87_003701, partial [Heliosperma pusillum]